MKTKSINVNIVLLIVIAVLLMVNFIMTSVLLSRPATQTQCSSRQKSLPCESIPIKLALDNSDCANKLLEAMNVTNVKILPKN